MNLLDKTKHLLFAVLIITLSCKEKFNIGIPKEPQDNIGAFFQDTLTLETSTVWYDSISSTFSLRSPYLMAGEYHDNYFGRLKAETYTSLFMETANNFATAPVLDSAVITLWPFVGQDSVINEDIQKIEFFEIEQSHSWLGEKYYIFSQALNTKPQDLAEGRFLFKFNPFKRSPKDSKIPLPEYRARLNQDFGNKLLSLMQLNNEDLKNVFPGILIKGSGSKMFTYRTLSADTSNKITLYYKDITGRAGVQKFLFGSDSAAFYRITKDWSGTKLSLLNESNREISSSQTDNLCYVQTGIGLYTKVKIPYLDKIAQGRNILINKAELVLSCPDTQESNAYRPFLSVFSIDKSNIPFLSNILQVKVIKDGTQNKVLFYSSYEKSRGGYVFDITSYIQKAIYNFNPQNGILIGGNKIFTSNNNPPNTNFLIDRAVFYDNTLSSAIGNQKRMKLNLYYTIVD
ncbi:MAG: hypothetical protein EAZ07_03015 [Cytophagales bacterium]|nr:MAG: hypothetical protein EAZ07_03015 [Cytophagales bacterium]